jgi:hypothetical protein
MHWVACHLYRETWRATAAALLAKPVPGSPPWPGPL